LRICEIIAESLECDEKKKEEEQKHVCDNTINGDRRLITLRWGNLIE